MIGTPNSTRGALGTWTACGPSVSLGRQCMPGRPSIFVKTVHRRSIMFSHEYSTEPARQEQH
jgi:hypothetical protein